MRTLFFLLLFLCSTICAQEKETPLISEGTFAGLKLRNIGPAFASGRIADIAIHPENDNIWYVAVGSGGVWKTINAGVTWTPIFDSQESYSIGCVTIDPNKPYTLAEIKIISLLEKQNNLLEELIRDIDRIHGEVETIRLKL